VVVDVPRLVLALGWVVHTLERTGRNGDVEGSRHGALVVDAVTFGDR